jgi:ABC-type phosphate transport system substrate-binding protein
MRSVAGLSAIAVAGSLALAAGPAGAATVGTVTTTPTGANNLIIGTGSATTYGMLQQLDTLYNASPGCTLVVDFPAGVSVGGVVTPTAQPLDYSCLTPAQEQSGGVLDPINSAVGVTPNPFNDVAVSEPPVGSSNGILQIESATGSAQALNNKYGSSNAGQAFNVYSGASYARSSRTPASSDNEGLNFVAYATDGVDWVHYSTVGLATTPSDIPGNLLSTPEVQGVWNGLINNWSQLGGAAAPILVFSAQEGSGTQSTWKSSVNAMNGTDPSTVKTVNCFNVSGLSLQTATSQIIATNCAGPINIFENETAQMVLASLPASLTNPNATSPGLGAGATVTGSGASATYTLTGTTKPAVCTNWYLGCSTSPISGGVYTYTFRLPTQNSVLGSSIFFYSSGLFNHQCILAKHANTAVSCAHGNFVNYSMNSLGQDTFQLGQIGGSATIASGVANANVIPAGTCAINPSDGDNDPCLPTQLSVLTQDFPVWRYLYNVYANAAATSEPPASAAALNYIGETGFLCNPNTATITNPADGNTYLTDIQNTILNSGFFPLSGGSATGTVSSALLDELSVTNPAWKLYPTSGTNPYAPYIANTHPAANTHPQGYCLTFSTDTVSGKGF